MLTIKNEAYLKDYPLFQYISVRFYLPNNSLWFHDLSEMVSLAVRYAILNT